MRHCRSRVSNITNAAGFACDPLLTLLLCNPIDAIASTCGWISCACDAQQRDREGKPNKAKAHRISYGIRLVPLRKTVPQSQRELKKR
jgi:hypothetical protein